MNEIIFRAINKETQEVHFVRDYDIAGVVFRKQWQEAPIICINDAEDPESLNKIMLLSSHYDFEEGGL